MIKIPSVSRKHAKVELINKMVYLTPITQNSPTLVNDETISEPFELRDGDIISIGGRHFRYDHALGKKQISSKLSRKKFIYRKFRLHKRIPRHDDKRFKRNSHSGSFKETLWHHKLERC
jgi:hypothetical protein